MKLAITIGLILFLVWLVVVVAVICLGEQEEEEIWEADESSSIGRHKFTHPDDEGVIF